MTGPIGILGRAPLRILLVDDQPMVRMGLRILLQQDPGILVVGEAGTAALALAQAAQLMPDVIIMDVEMPGMDGITATGLVMEMCRGCRVIILTIYGDDATRARAMAAGAWAFLEKSTPADLQTAIRTARDSINSF